VDCRGGSVGRGPSRASCFDPEVGCLVQEPFGSRIRWRESECSDRGVGLTGVDLAMEDRHWRVLLGKGGSARRSGIPGDTKNEPGPPQKRPPVEAFRCYGAGWIPCALVRGIRVTLPTETVVLRPRVDRVQGSGTWECPVSGVDLMCPCGRHGLGSLSPEVRNYDHETSCIPSLAKPVNDASDRRAACQQDLVVRHHDRTRLRPTRVSYRRYGLSTQPDWGW
jgi:hypothetical protein